jgi:YggT family protein
MQDAVTFVISALFDLLVITFLLRLLLAWVRADYRNPLSQFVVKVTNPLVIPARRFIPSVGGIDAATVVVLLVLQSLATAILVKLACVGDAAIGQIVLLGLVRLVHLVLNLYFWLIIVYVLSSWIGTGGYNPVLAVLASVVTPLLAPLRRFIPPIGGFDLSPVFALLAIGFLERLMPSGLQMAGLICLRF